MDKTKLNAMALAATARWIWSKHVTRPERGERAVQLLELPNRGNPWIEISVAWMIDR
jgi:hypothetical protein